MMDTSSPSSAPVPVIKAPRPRTPPKGRREVLVDGRDNCARVLGIVQAAAGISQVVLRAEFKCVGCCVVEKAQLGGPICFLCISFRGLGLHQLSIFGPWCHAEILFRKRNIIIPYSRIEKAVYSSARRKKNLSEAYMCMILQESNGDGTGFVRKSLLSIKQEKTCQGASTLCK